MFGGDLGGGVDARGAVGDLAERLVFLDERLAVGGEAGVADRAGTGDDDAAETVATGAVEHIGGAHHIDLHAARGILPDAG